MVGPNTAAHLKNFIENGSPPRPTRDQFETMIARLALGTGAAKSTVAEEQERLSLYWLALRSFPLVDLREAFEKLLKTHEYMPKPAKIVTAVESAGAARKHRMARARRLLYKHRTEYEPPKEYLTADELEKLRREDPDFAVVMDRAEAAA